MRKEVGNMSEKKAILYVQTSDMPERQYSPLVLAQTAKAMDLEPKVYFLGQSLRILKPGEPEKIKLGSFPSVAEMLEKTMEMGIEIFVCEASKRMLDWDTVELIPGVKIVGASTLNDLVLEADATMWF
jgi:predicted peroxiredoxin